MCAGKANAKAENSTLVYFHLLKPRAASYKSGQVNQEKYFMFRIAWNVSLLNMAQTQALMKVQVQQPAYWYTYIYFVFYYAFFGWQYMMHMDTYLNLWPIFFFFSLQYPQFLSQETVKKWKHPNLTLFKDTVNREK